MAIYLYILFFIIFIILLLGLIIWIKKNLKSVDVEIDSNNAEIEIKENPEIDKISKDWVSDYVNKKL